MRSTGSASDNADTPQASESAAEIVGNLPPKSSSPRPLRWPGRIVVSLAWLATFTVGTIAVLRLVFHDGANLLIWLNAFTRYVYLPAYAALIVAILFRRRRLAVVNLLIIGCHLYLLAPDYLRDRRFAPAATSAKNEALPPKKLRIFFANVRLESRAKGPMLREIRDANPDVVVFVEFSIWWRRAVMLSPTMAAFKYGSGLEPDQAGGHSVNILSKLPLSSDTREWVARRCIETVEIPLGTQTLRLIGIHAPRPMAYRDNDYSGFWKRGVPALLESPGPTVVLGDFNATQYSYIYQRLKAGGLRSAHEDQGRGYATTWPNGYYPLPPIRIDQALLSRDVICTGIAEGQGNSSDHKPLILDVEIPQHRSSGQ